MICGLPRRKRKEKKAESSRESRLTLQQNGFFRFLVVFLAMYFLNLHWLQQGREGKLESPFINDTDSDFSDNSKIALWKWCFFYYNNIRDTF